VGLGAVCLELHSHKTTKRAVIDDLRRTLALEPPPLGPMDDDARMLVDLRDRLNAYCEAVNAPIGESGISPFDAYGELLGLRDRPRGAAPPPCEVPTIIAWTRFDRKRREALVEELQTRLAVVGVPRDHPFHGSRRTVLLPTETDRLREL